MLKVLAVFTDVTNTLFYGFVQRNKCNWKQKWFNKTLFYSIQIMVSLCTPGYPSKYSWSTCLNLLNTHITDMCHHIWLIFYNWNETKKKNLAMAWSIFQVSFSHFFFKFLFHSRPILSSLASNILAIPLSCLQLTVNPNTDIKGITKWTHLSSAFS